ncbi:hypothetical protein [Nocardia carnea]|uniref:hypothetical protein n=1 Tax=Nocardia carnea TaxID=37328 RepID=UPI0024541AD0|nr:hypothetical protein [Nocardia carnea]
MLAEVSDSAVPEAAEGYLSWRPELSFPRPDTGDEWRNRDALLRSHDIVRKSV